MKILEYSLCEWTRGERREEGSGVRGQYSYNILNLKVSFLPVKMSPFSRQGLESKTVVQRSNDQCVVLAVGPLPPRSILRPP